ncbi:MAG: hypothetical protein LWW85_15460, partial [Marinilabiliales bacterium]|nr:hypothetical protein [Marinilabiliales bacterium]
SHDLGISWQVKKGASHSDHIEMSGLKVSSVIHYGVDDQGALLLTKKVIFPMLRTLPNNTHASLIVNYKDPGLQEIRVNGQVIKEYPIRFGIKGNLNVVSATEAGIEVSRNLFPSVDKAALLETVELKNVGSNDCKITLTNLDKPLETDPAKGVYGSYVVQMEIKPTGNFLVRPGEHLSFSAIYSGRKATDEPYAYAPDFEWKKREKFVEETFANLSLETPNDTINRAFAFAKIRATESIYDTKGGLMHGPGGEAYYAAIWANDQAEYANPFFPFLGNLNGNESAINSYRHFARFMNPEYKPIPSSIIAEGTDIWNGAGDRGDMAMIAYGASRYALATGDRAIARELWPLITWCLEYLERKKTPEGVIASDNDELEGRFYAGKVNLSTNCLTYSAYLSAAHLAEELGQREVIPGFRQKAQQLRENIEKYFGANVQGFDTYRYHRENDKLRAWICIPLVMGITERKEQTIQALFSDYLWTNNGILTESGSTTFWDRSTLYAFRGLLSNGATDRCMPYFAYYSSTRLLGEHVPYPVEAWPEGGQRHLSAESALYCRAVTEGLFGITPTGFHKFTLTPWLPKNWSFMHLKNIKAFGHDFSLEVRKSKGTYQIKILDEVSKGVIVKRWNGKEPVEIELKESK